MKNQRVKNVAICLALVAVLSVAGIGNHSVYASSTLTKSNDAGKYGKIKGTLYAGAASKYGYEFTHSTSVTKAPAGNFYLRTDLEIQNNATGKKLTSDYEQGANRAKSVSYYFQFDHITSVNYKKVKFAVFGCHQVKGTGYVVFTKNVYNYSDDYK